MLRWVVRKQVNVVVFTIDLDQFRLEVNTNFREDDTKPIDGISVKYTILILCSEDQMDVKLKYTVCDNRKMARKTFKFRLYPNRQQQERLTATLDAFSILGALPKCDLRKVDFLR